MIALPSKLVSSLYDFISATSLVPMTTAFVRLFAPIVRLMVLDWSGDMKTNTAALTRTVRKRVFIILWVVQGGSEQARCKAELTRGMGRIGQGRKQKWREETAFPEALPALRAKG